MCPIAGQGVRPQLEGIVTGLQSGGRPAALVKAVDGVLSFRALHRQLLEFGAVCAY